MGDSGPAVLLPGGGGAELDPPAQVFGRMRRHFSPRTAAAARLLGRGAVEASASGSRVTLSDGRTALDFGAYAVGLLGHRPPSVVAAVRRQLDVMTISTRTLGNPVAARAAEAIVAHLGGGLPRVHLGLGGSDAVEAAVKLARLATGRPRVLAVEGAYHGKSMGALGLTHHARFRAGLEGLLPGVTHLAADDPDGVERACRDGDVAALVFEPVQGENGVRPLEPEVLARWCAAARAHGALIIADEIQTGLRRCGERSLAQAWGLPVDAVLLGKALGGGVMPLSALVCSDALYQPLADDPFLHTATFGGHPPSCAAVPAALSLSEEYAGRGRAMAEVLRKELTALADGHRGLITEVRGSGLLWGLQFGSDKVVERVTTGLARRGLLVSPCVSDARTLRLLPPITATDGELDEALTILADVLAALPAP